jgi:hypothetical protein
MNVILRAVAVLLGKAYRLLDGIWRDASVGLAEAVEEASDEVDRLISLATALASHGRAAQQELHSKLDQGSLLAGQANGEAPIERLRLGVRCSEEILERLVGCAGEILQDLHDAAGTLEPTARQLQAVDDLLARVSAPHS